MRDCLSSTEARQFSSDCGIALRFEWSQHEQVKAILNAANVEIDSYIHYERALSVAQFIAKISGYLPMLLSSHTSELRFPGRK